MSFESGPNHCLFCPVHLLVIFIFKFLIFFTSLNISKISSCTFSVQAGVYIFTNGLLLFEIPFELLKLVQSLFNEMKVKLVEEKRFTRDHLAFELKSFKQYQRQIKCKLFCLGSFFTILFSNIKNFLEAIFGVT